MRVERGLHRTDRAELLADGFEVAARLEYAGALCGHVCIVGERIPRAEDQVVERGERDEVLDQWGVVLGALSETDTGELGERAERLRHAQLGQFDAGDERG